MAYWDVSLLAADYEFSLRVAACAQIEGVNGAQLAIEWATANSWVIASAPGFGEKYGYAVAIGTPNPGRDPAVISDAEILSAVQALPPAG